MEINKSGTDVSAFEGLFRDGTGEAFRSALTASFAFASVIIHCAKKVRPAHGLELWDQAVQYELARINQSGDLFVDGTSLYLEKTDSQRVWQYGFSITGTRRRGQRLWTLPDGIIETPVARIAVEFDHGDTVGTWANQLIKAVRSCASGQITGVLYCFYMEKDPHSSGQLLGEYETFSDEFGRLLDAHTFGKRLGMVTEFPSKEVGRRIGDREVFDFFESTYVANKKAGTKSRETAQEILSSLRSLGAEICSAIEGSLYFESPSAQ